MCSFLFCSSILVLVVALFFVSVHQQQSENNWNFENSQQNSNYYTNRNLRAGQTGGGPNAGLGSIGGYQSTTPPTPPPPTPPPPTPPPPTPPPPTPPPPTPPPPTPPPPTPPPPTPPPNSDYGPPATIVYLQYGAILQDLYNPSGWQSNLLFYQTTSIPNPVGYNWLINHEYATGTYYNSFWETLQDSGVKMIYLSFAQLQSLPTSVLKQPSPINGPPGGGSVDNIALTYKVNGVYYTDVSLTSTPKTYQDFLSLLVEMGAAHDIDIVVSFGGEQACTDGTECNGPSTNGITPWMFVNGSGSGTANLLLTYLEMYGFYGVDFDIENEDIWTYNAPDEVDAFFSTLRDAQIYMSIAVIGGFLNTNKLTQEVIDRHLNVLTYFKDKSVNLMLYTDFVTQLDPIWIGSFLGSNPQIPPVVSSTANINIGFNTEVLYNTSASCASSWCPDATTYTSGLSSGEAAASSNYQVIVATNPTYTVADFGPAFWWIQVSVDLLNRNGDYIGTGSSAPTTPLTGGINLPSSQMILDFWNYDWPAPSLSSIKNTT